MKISCYRGRRKTRKVNMRYFITGVVLTLLGLYLLITPIDKLYKVLPNIPSPIAPKIGGGIALVIGIFILIIQIGEWSGKI